MREAVRLDRAAVRLSEDVGFVCHPDAEPRQFLSLRRPVAPEFLQGEGGEGDRA